MEQCCNERAPVSFWCTYTCSCIQSNENCWGFHLKRFLASCSPQNTHSCVSPIVPAHKLLHRMLYCFPGVKEAFYKYSTAMDQKFIIESLQNNRPHGNFFAAIPLSGHWAKFETRLSAVVSRSK